MPRQAIIRNQDVIQHILKKGTLFKCKFINIYYVTEEGDQSVAFFVKKKIGNAVKRNRSKRLIREFYRTNKQYFKKIKVIFIIKKYIPDLSRLEKDIKLFIENEKIIYLDH